MNNPKIIQDHLINEIKTKLGINLSPLNIPQFSHLSPEFGQYRLTHYLMKNNLEHNNKSRKIDDQD